MAKTTENLEQILAEKANALEKTNQPSSSASTTNRIQGLEDLNTEALDILKGNIGKIDGNTLKGNIENFIGMAQVPIGIAGPLLIRGEHAKGLFHIPLATTEGALVASYTRGAKACTMSQGLKTYYIADGVQRSPVFIFESCGTALAFQKWLSLQESTFKKITQQKSRFAQLQQVDTLIEGNHLICTFQFSTGDAAGQNMVTFCTQAICEYIIEHSPQKPQRWYLESNYAGDKKASHNALSELVKLKSLQKLPQLLYSVASFLSLPH